MRALGFVVRGVSSRGVPAYLIVVRDLLGPYPSGSGFGRATEMASVWPTEPAAKKAHDAYLAYLREDPARADEAARVAAYVVVESTEAELAQVRLVQVSS